MQRSARLVYAGMLCALVLSAPASAQQGLATDQSVHTSTKSPVLAGFLEYLVPWVGFAYAGDAGRGTVPNVVFLGGVALAVLGAEADQGDLLGFDCTAACTVGLVVAAVGRVWAIAGAVDTANDRNALVRAARSVSVQPSAAGGVSFGIRLRVE